MRLAFFLVLALVCIGLARGDFASGESRSEEAAFIETDLFPARGDTSTTVQPLAPAGERGIADALAEALGDLVARYRAWHEAPATRDSPEARPR